MIRIRGEGLDLVATGDLQSSGLGCCVPEGGIDWLLLPHHGRFDAGLPRWLARVAPGAALASPPRRVPRSTAALLRRLEIPLYPSAPRRPVVLRPAGGPWRVALE
ncbi:MAG: hypothetical protein V3T77_01860 [Planctomycetota bacterium]